MLTFSGHCHFVSQISVSVNIIPYGNNNLSNSNSWIVTDRQQEVPEPTLAVSSELDRMPLRLRPRHRGNGANKKKRLNRVPLTACWWTCWSAVVMWVPVTCVSRHPSQKMPLRPRSRQSRPNNVIRVFTNSISDATWRQSDRVYSGFARVRARVDIT